MTSELTPRAAPSLAPVQRYLLTLSNDLTRRNVVSQLNAVLRALDLPNATALTFPWHSLTADMVLMLRERLSAKYSVRTANVRLALVRSVCREAFASGLMPQQEYTRICAGRSVRGNSEDAGRAISHPELVRLFEAAWSQGEPTAARDAALLALLYGAGLRRAEAVGLDLDDYHRAEASIHVLGKGRKHRVTPLGGSAMAAVEAWIAVRGAAPGPLLLIVHAGVVVNRRMSTDSVWKRAQSLAKRAGVEHIAPHDFRRTAITAALDRHVDLIVVRDFAGHANVQTTARYDRGAQERKRQVATALDDIPVRGAS